VNSSQTIHILLVEDSATDALLIEEALADALDFQHKFTHVESLSTGLAHAEAGHVDVVLLDLGLHDSQGVDTFRQFRRRAPTIPVLVLTGRDEISVGLLAIYEGAQDYLVKRNINPSMLRRVIRSAMERHRAAAALAESAERFQLAVSGANAGLWDWNVKTDAMYISPHFKEIMGYEDHQLFNNAQAHHEAIHPHDFEWVMAKLKAHLKHRSPYDVEYRVGTHSGDIRWIQSRGQALWNNSGEPYRMVGWIMDVTDRKRAEEALRISREDLRLLSANILHIREGEKTRIARELHDDLGQQLTALKIEVAMVEHELKTDGSRSHRIGLSNVYALIDRLVGSVRRIAADLRPVMLDDLGLIAAIDWLINEFSTRHNVRVVTSFDARGIAFNGDSGTAVFRMIQEALTNIARHSGATEVMLEIARDEPNCVVRVADNGRGTECDARPNRDSFGLLGLRERAARLGGEIRISTGPGLGFALTITLPLAAVEAKEAE